VDKIAEKAVCRSVIVPNSAELTKTALFQTVFLAIFPIGIEAAIWLKK